MGLFDKLFGKRKQEFDVDQYNKNNQKQIDHTKQVYDMDTLEGIAAIPVPTRKQTTEPSSVVVQLEYILQRKATEHKKNGQMDLAIECLRKSNQIMPFSWFAYSSKDYERLVEYLKKSGKFDEARVEQAKIDKRFGNDTQSKETRDRLQAQARSNSTDLVHVMEHRGCCSECAKYRNRVYTLSGKDSRYPAYPKFLVDNPQHCNLTESFFYHGISSMWDENYGDVDSVKYSNRPFVDDRTVEEKTQYESMQKKKRDEIINRKDYDLIREHLPSLAPKSYGGYVRMKNSNSVNYRKLCKAAQDAGIQLELDCETGIRLTL